jgi:hypothetical protein
MDGEVSMIGWLILVWLYAVLYEQVLTATGKRIVELQASLGMLSMAKPPGQQSPNHSSIDSVEVLTEDAKTTYVNPKRMADLARNVGLPDVMRWVPRDVSFCIIRLRP